MVDFFGDVVYVIGGFDGVSVIAVVEVYDVCVNKWWEVVLCFMVCFGIVLCCIL